MWKIDTNIIGKENICYIYLCTHPHIYFINTHTHNTRHTYPRKSIETYPSEVTTRTHKDLGTLLVSIYRN